MLEALIIVLLVLWLLGFITGTGGNLVYFLLVVAAIVLVIRLVSGRKAV